MRRILYRLTNNLPCRIISEGDVPYLERYFLCAFGGLRIYLHRFTGSDPDRGLHSHPWSWAVSLVLAGWYFEERFSGTDQPVLRRVRWLNILLGESFHRVVMPAHWPQSTAECPMSIRPTVRQAMAVKDCWTLFIHREQKTGRRWGFMRPLFTGGRLEVDPGARVGDPVAVRQVGSSTSVQVFTPFTYPGGATSSGQWWKKVPKGRDEPRRAPL